MMMWAESCCLRQKNGHREEEVQVKSFNILKLFLLENRHHMTSHEDDIIYINAWQNDHKYKQTHCHNDIKTLRSPEGAGFNLSQVYNEEQLLWKIIMHIVRKIPTCSRILRYHPLNPSNSLFNVVFFIFVHLICVGM